MRSRSIARPTPGSQSHASSSVEDATWAVDNIEVDWNEQAVKSAASYLEFKGFSRQGLIDQLIFEGYTPEQAAHGVTENGL